MYIFLIHAICFIICIASCIPNPPSYNPNPKIPSLTNILQPLSGFEFHPKFPLLPTTLINPYLALEIP